MVEIVNVVAAAPAAMVWLRVPAAKSVVSERPPGAATVSNATASVVTPLRVTVSGAPMPSTTLTVARVKLSVSSPSSAMVTVAVSRLRYGFQSRWLNMIATVKVSLSSTSASRAMGIDRVAVRAYAGTVTVRGTTPTSAADALPGPLAKVGVTTNVTPPCGAFSLKRMVSSALLPSTAVAPLIQ